MTIILFITLSIFCARLFRLIHCKTNLLEDLFDPVVVNVVSFCSENFANMARINSVYFLKLIDFTFNLLRQKAVYAFQPFSEHE